MGQRQIKRMRRVARKQVERSQKKIIRDFLHTAAMFSLRGRLRLALMIVFKKV